MPDWIEFLKELKYSYFENDRVYTEGSCFRLFKIIKAVEKNANPYYSHLDGHWIIEIKDRFYDINGEISGEYVQAKEYALIEDQKMLSSAYVPTYKGQCAGYGKYLKTN